MKLRFTFLSLFLTLFIYAQQAPAYYNGVNFSKTRNDLKADLVSLIERTHTRTTTYDGLRDLLPKSDADPQKPNNMLLVYGYSDSSDKYQRSRASYPVSNWNREHVYPNSLGRPELGKSGPGADGHHLRPADTQLNSDRGNLPFNDGTGYAKKVGAGWYPGDEWKGDVARIMMYMYLRYADRCKLDRVALGPATYSSDVPDILLKWNVEDPVSDFERQRNNVVAEYQGNRNPFIDNPYLATVIWGGPTAQNTWPNSFNGGGEPDTEAPSTPTNLQATETSANTITLSWTASTDNYGIASYDIFVNNVFNKTVYSNNGVISGLNPETTYSIYVVAKDYSGNLSGNSSAIEATTKESGSTNPGEPNPGGGQGTTCGTEDFENIPASQSSYADRVWTNNGITWTATEARTDVQDEGRAIVLKKSLSSSTISSGIGSLSVRTGLPYRDSAGTLTLKINGIEKGKINYSSDTQTININNINVDGNIIIELVNDSSARVRLDNLSWTCYEKDLGTDDLTKDKNKLTIYPNPVTNNEFYIKGIDKNETIDIYSINGQLVQTIRNANNDSKVRLNKLPKGVYIVKTKKQSTKLIIN